MAIDAAAKRGIERLASLRHGALARELAPPRRADGLPLAALRPKLDGGWPTGARWVAAGDAERGELFQPLAETVTFRLRLTPDARLRASVTLASRLSRSAMASVALRSGDGRELELWSELLGVDRWAVADVSLPMTLGTDVELVLRAAVERRPPLGRGMLRWLDPAIEGIVPAPPARAARGDGPAAAPAASGDGPLISILTAVHDPEPGFLAATLASVRRQTYGRWELCLVDDGSSDERVRRLIADAADDERVRVERSDAARGIAGATNAALELATGDYVALLDHDDTIEPDALETIVRILAERPETDVVYSDEDLFNTDGRLWLYLKPDWSPDLLRSNMYTCHLGVYRRALAVAVGGFRSEFDGSQDYDFMLRLSERTDRIVHLPRVLYHWRVHERSASWNPDAKPYAYEAARSALADHLRRTETGAEAHHGPEPGQYRVLHHVDPATSVALVLPLPEASAATAPALRHAADSWLAATHRSWQLVMAGGEEALALCSAALADTLPAERLLTVPAGAATDRPALANLAARASGAEHVVLLESPVEALSPDWLRRLIGFAARPGIAAAGALTVTGDGRAEHGGVVVDDGLPLPLLHGAHAGEPSAPGVLRLSSNLSAVSGVVATARATFDALGGLDETLGELAEVDYCLRAREQGLRIVFVPDAVLRHVGPLPVNDLDALARFRARWRDRLDGDPYYNPGYVRYRADLVPLRGT